jgi:predicted lipid-binding transport protein (Tim44 family)
MLRRSYRSLFALAAIAGALAFAIVEADARSRGSAGSRGARTYSAPPPTATAPKAAQPVQRSMTQPGQPGATAGRAATPAAQQGGLFNRPGLLGGLAAGFLGAGLIGLLMGNGFLGGLSGLASLFGLLIQVGLVVLVGYLLWTWWQRRSQPATAGGPNMSPADMRHTMDAQPAPRTNAGGLGGALGGLGALGGSPMAGGPVDVKPEDFDAFERLLGEIQTAYGNEDLNALRSLVTPEMLSYYADELAHNASQGDINQMSDIKLLQGDLAEAWREGDTEYATVAMRYSINDRIVERASGRLVEQLPSEVTELWTFRRDGGRDWILSAVQQTE